MIRSFTRIAALSVSVVLFGCAVPAGVPYGAYYDAGAGYYEPAGGFFGAWGPGYLVGPYHDHDHRFGGQFIRGGLRGGGVPSIAGAFHGGVHGGGGRAGGGHGGGFRGGGRR